MDPKVSVKVSRECSPSFKFVNTSQVGRVMSREINEQLVESETEGSRKGYIYILALLFQNKKKTNIKKKKR